MTRPRVVLALQVVSLGLMVAHCVVQRRLLHALQRQAALARFVRPLRAQALMDRREQLRHG